MSPEPAKILHLEDSENDAFLILHLLQKEFGDLEVVQVDNQADFMRAMEDPRIRMVLSDYSLPTYDGMSALSALRQLRPELPFIFVSGAMGEDMAVECMKIGATDYVLKSNLKRLPTAIRRAFSERDTRMTLTEAARVGRVVPWYWNEVDDTWLFGYLVQEILGYAPGLLKSTPGFLKAQVHVEDLPRFVASFSPSGEKTRKDFDCRLRHRDGRWLWTRWTLAWAEGRCRGILQDITELRLAQDALIQSQRLETLGTMIGGITHDFGNLIAAMSGAAELLGEGPLTERQRRHVDLLARSCERAKGFRDDLLRLARKEDAPERRPTDLNEVTREAATLLGHALAKSMVITTELQEDLPRVQAVPAQILQLLMNLGINARDAMGTQGQITLRTGVETLAKDAIHDDSQPQGTYVYVEVEDTGPGIPTEVLPHIFDTFFTTKNQGTGLGLAMVRAIAQQHDAVIQLDSSPGKGVRFRVLLPVMG